MMVFFPAAPRLDITEAAGDAIPVGHQGPVSILLPAGASPNQTVKVRAQGFAGKVRIEVVIVPDSGPRSVNPVEIEMAGQAEQTVTVPIVLTPNVSNRIYAWTR